MHKSAQTLWFKRRQNDDFFVMNTTLNRVRWHVIGLRCVLAAAGLALALLGSSLLKAPLLNTDVLVWVNQQPITAKHMDFVVQRLGKTSLDELSEASRKALLQLLIDEELLLQRAESLGIYREDPGLRKQLVQAVISRVVTEFLNTSVDEQQLRVFYRQHRGVFESPKRLAVSALRFSTLAAAEKARRTLLASEQLSVTEAPIKSALLAHVPSALLPAHMLRRYLGTSLATVELALESGEVTEPVSRADGFYLVYVRRVKPAWIPEFEQVKQEVRAEYLRRGRDWALEKTLATLWASSSVEINRRVIGTRVLTDTRALTDTMMLNDKGTLTDTRTLTESMKNPIAAAVGE